jgi:hypothetical protein
VSSIIASVSPSQLASYKVGALFDTLLLIYVYRIDAHAGMGFFTCRNSQQ